MKKIFALVLCLGLLVIGLGCETNKTKVGEGAVVGGLLGAAGGAAIGSLSGNAGAGAGIGAGIGAATGALIGSQIEKKPAQEAQSANTEQMSIEQVVDLSKEGLSDTAIIAKLKETNSKFSLSAAQISYLKGQGVSQKVIDAMQEK